MKALNWPNLMATTSQLYLVNKTYLEYSSLDTFYPKVYKDATNAMNYWRGDSLFLGRPYSKGQKLC